jgi:hypothetical protein
MGGDILEETSREFKPAGARLRGAGLDAWRPQKSRHVAPGKISNGEVG